MKSTAFAVLVGVALVACRDESTLSKQQQQYDVVQEGSAAGSNTPLTTSVPPVTATGADTTTAFQLPGATGNPAQPGTMAGTLATPNVGLGGVPAYTPGPPSARGAIPQRAAAPGSAAPQRSAATAPPADRIETPPPPPTLTGGFSRPPVTQPREPPAPTRPDPEQPAEDEPQDEPADGETVEEPAPPPSDTAPPPPGAQEHDDSREG